LKKLPITPLLSIAAVLMAPAVAQAQPAVSTPSTPSTATTPSTVSTPSTPSGATLPGTWEGPTTYPGTPEIPSTPRAPGASANIFQILVGAGVEYDDNVLRDTSDISDTILFGSVGLRADKAYGLQRFRADIEATAYKYNDVSELDYNTFNYNLAWDWSFTPRVHGTISADQKEYRETFLDTSTGLNRTGLRTERVELAEGVYELGAAWRVLAGIAQTSSKSDQPNSWDGSPEVQSVHLGVGYELATGTSLTARLRRGDGEYRDTFALVPAGREFDETETDVLLRWPVTAKTAVEGRLGYLDREHSSAPQRDFSGVVGNATVSWDVTGKTRVLAGFSHYLSSTGLAVGGSIESDQLWLGPVWKPTIQTAVKLRYEYTSRDWRDVPAVSPDNGREETTQNLMIGFDWEPRPAIAVSTSLRRERLKSNVYSGYRANVFGVAARVYF
jgi:exopolysaccharide biosynthesis operon protein EpsL